jgi:hypothetical protein
LLKFGDAPLKFGVAPLPSPKFVVAPLPFHYVQGVVPLPSPKFGHAPLLSSVFWCCAAAIGQVW